MMRRNPAILLAAVLGATAVCVALAVRGSSAVRPLPVILITLDTTRLDRLGCYGYPGKTSPWIDRLARDSVVFERHYVQAPMTLPSHTSIMSGLNPVRHGIRYNGERRLEDRAVTLAEVLQGHGFRTCAIISAGVLHPLFGLDQGFEEYSWDEDGTNAAAQSDAEEATRRALGWILENGEEGRFFQWVHYFDPHGPHKEETPAPGFDDVYDSSIAHADEHIGALLEGLRQHGLYDDALIVLTADHGQSLGEHRYSGHVLCLYQETMHAPLLIKFPRGEHAGTRVESVTRSIDILPTVLAYAGIPAPPTDGVDLTDRIQGRGNGKSLEAYGETFIAGRERIAKRSLVWDRWKLITKPDLEPGEDLVSLLETRRAELEAITPEPDWTHVRTAIDQVIASERHVRELYDLVADPREANNLYDSRPDIARMMEARLAAYLAISSEGAPSAASELDEDLKRMLEALGY